MSKYQSEQDARETIEAICSEHLKSYEAVVVARKPLNHNSYIASFGVLGRDGTFSQSFLEEIFLKLVQNPNCLFSFEGTQRDVKDLSFEELYIDAKIEVVGR